MDVNPITPSKKSLQFGRHTLTLETGEIARQAHGAVMVSLDDTCVLVTVVGKKEAKPGQDFFPLTVDYMERTYAAGRIPGGFFKREGRPTEKETLTSRLIDRPIRPLFPDGFYNEVQVVATVVSSNNEIDSDIPALIGASAALALSGIPFNGPIGAARVAYADGQYILNPTATELKTSKLNLVVAGTQQAVLMVESEADELSEEVMLGAVVFGHEQMQPVIDLINELADEAGKPLWDWTPPQKDEVLIGKITEIADAGLQEAYRIRQKQTRTEKIASLRDEVLRVHVREAAEPRDANMVMGIFGDIESKIVRGRILSGEPRIDGRDTRTIRPISMRTGVLPRAHQVVEVVVPGRLAVDLEAAELGVVDRVQYQVHRIVVAVGHPAHPEHAGRGGAHVPGGHVGARVEGGLNCPVLVQHEGGHHAGLGVGVEREQE